MNTGELFFFFFVIGMYELDNEFIVKSLMEHGVNVNVEGYDKEKPF